MRAHYPLHPQHLELADRMGVMVWDEVPVFAQGYRGFEAPGVTEKGLAYIQAMVERDRNHASVLAWSIANELSGRMTEDQEDYIHRAAQLLRRLDRTRLRTIAIFGWPQAPPSDVYHELDALGINSYFGWYPGPNGSTEDRQRLGPFLDQMREYYPELALFVTEFGAESNRKGPPDQKGTYAFQRRLLTHHVQHVHRKALAERRACVGDARLPLPPRLGGRQPDAADRLEPEGPRQTTAAARSRSSTRWPSSTSRCHRWRESSTRAEPAGRRGRRAKRRRRGRGRPRRSSTGSAPAR